jgi:alpha-amylase
LKHLFLGLDIHNHQPVGNFTSVLEDAYAKAYLPFLALLERHPSVRLSFHVSGALLDWLLERRREYVQRLVALVHRGQIEMMGGGYYEPVLPAIPERDRVGQVKHMSNVVKEQFGAAPTGCWLPERVWEPHLSKSLAKAGMVWTVTDDSHFKMVGLEEQELFGYYVTEEEGQTTRIFASSKFLRYAIPWWDVERVMESLRSWATEEGSRIAVFGDDGEKFGVWPTTYRYCWERGWMERFFTALEQNRDWLTTIPLGEYVRQHPPLGRVYLPTASYAEMMEWAMPAAKSLQFTRLLREVEGWGRQDMLSFLRGGFWRSFLVKYPESNLMHKKMLRVHGKVWQAQRRGGADPGLLDLWKGQCNCPYWHGVFGGIYLNHIRSANFRHLLRAERLADEILHSSRPWLQSASEDYDADGRDEVLVDSDAFSLYFKPSQGGALCEWDLRQAEVNLQNVLARRPEAYHLEFMEQMRHAKDQQGEAGQVRSIHEGLKVKDPSIHTIIHDRFPRFSLQEHLLDGSTTVDDFAASRYQDMGDFAEGEFQAQRRKKGRRLTVTLYRDGHVRIQGHEGVLRLEKRLVVEAGREGLSVEYTVQNLGPRPVACVLASEWNVNLQDGRNSYAQVLSAGVERLGLLEKRALKDIQAIRLLSEHLGISLALAVRGTCELWLFPVESVSNSEEGLEKVYQGSCVTLLFPLSLDVKGSQHMEFSWSWGKVMEA